LARPGETILKDQNFMARRMTLRGSKSIEKSLALDEDVNFLMRFGVIDYSLVVGVMSAAEWEGCIIDIFTSYSAKKAGKMGGWQYVQKHFPA
jgi:Phosphatidylinositol-4-phosphate 5-Kinase